MKRFIVNIAKWFAFAGLFTITSMAIRTDSRWYVYPCLICWAMVAGYLGSRLDEWKELSRDINRLTFDLKSLEEFICESEILKDEVTKFGEVNYDPRHHHHMSNKAGMPECHCSAPFVRADVLRACDDYYGFLINRHPSEYEYKPDGSSEITFNRWAREFKEKVQNEILPIFKRLHKAEPEAFPKDHIAWLTRKEMDDSAFKEYLSWLIPSLRYSFKPNISTPEGKAALLELERIANPERESLADK
jgi:hypothetical protein